MKRKTKTQEAAEYIGKQLGAVPFQPEELNGHYYVVGHPDPVQSPYQLREYARELCLFATVEEINRETELSLQVTGHHWLPLIQDAHGFKAAVTGLLREQSATRLNINDPSGTKEALIKGFQFGHALAATGVEVRGIYQTADGTWIARQPLVWASKRGFLHEWSHYAITYGASPVRTVLTEGPKELHRFDQWVTLERLTKLIPFA